MSDVSPIPKGMNTITAYLTVPDSVEAIEFYTKAFGAVETMRMPGPGGQGTMHAEIRIGDSSVMLTDENPQWEMQAPHSLGGSPVSLMMYVKDSDKTFKQAIDAGCEVKFPLNDMFWGDRMGKVVDPYGYQWSIATHVEDVSAEQMQERQEKWLAEMTSSGDGG